MGIWAIVILVVLVLIVVGGIASYNRFVSQRNLIKDAMVQARPLHVHLGLSLFNANFCENASRYPGASRTIQCDGTRPSWVCFFDDELWKYYQKNVTEMARLGAKSATARIRRRSGI